MASVQDNLPDLERSLERDGQDALDFLQHMEADAIGSILLEMFRVNLTKRADYTGDRGIFANFQEASEQVHIETGRGIEYMISTKQSRLKGLLKPGAAAPNNESVEDTLLDRAVYSVIALAAYRAGEYEKD